MADYKFGFDSTQWQPIVSERGYNKNSYGPFENKVMNGYITGRVERNEVDLRYMVFIPELQTNVECSVLLRIGDTNVNGIGYKPPSIEVGTPVMIQMFQESRQAIIIGTVNMPGLKYSSEVSEERETKSPDQFPHWRSPFPIALTELGPESEVTVDPLDLRAENPIYEEPVQTGNKVPGAISMKSPKGINFNYTPSADIVFKPINITKVQGKLKTLDEKANEQVQMKMEKAESEVEKVIERSFSFKGGQIVAGPVVRQISGIISGFGVNIEGLNNITNTINQAIGAATRVAQLGQSVLDFFSQNPANIVGSLLDEFGQFNIDLGVVGVDLNVSLTSIDLNLDFRIGTGIPLVDNTLNQVLDSALNSVLDNILGDFNIGGLLGFGSSDSIDPKSTFNTNLFTPILRMAGQSGYNRLGLGQIINEFSNIGDNFDWIGLDDELNYLRPTVYVNTNSLNLNIPSNKLGKYIVNMSADPQLFELPEFIGQFYNFQTESSYAALAALASTVQSDKLKCLFLYAYYTLDAAKVNQLASILFPEKRVAVLNNYDWTDKATYDLLPNLLLGEDSVTYPLATTVYDPLDFNLDTFKTTLSSQFTTDALQYLDSGQLAGYINQVIINRSRVDVRLKILKYARLKELVTLTFPYISIGFDND